PSFAERVVAEYRRFLFLAASAGHPVTPSEEVDQAWHLHLVYTRSYWDELCGEVLGFPLHHGPTVGGPAEGAKFTDWYQRTLDSYRRLFGTEPPADIWPAPDARFANADRFQRINTAEHWVVPKPAVARPGGARRSLPTAALAAATALVLTGCLAAAGTNPGLLASAAEEGDNRAAFVVFIVLAVAVVLVLALARPSGGRSRRSGRGWGSGDSTGGGSSGCGADSGCGGGGCGGGGCGGGGCGGG
ncbi:MAG: hypothetical protein AAFO29_18495, partial [Actinomycetota bacterium]